MTPASPTQIAIVGCGYITQAEHVPALLASLPSVAVTATVDADPERAAAVGQLFGAQAFASSDEALAEGKFETVLIATPATSHVALIAQAARAGKHILVEKPIAYSLAEARRPLKSSRVAA